MGFQLHFMPMCRPGKPGTLGEIRSNVFDRFTKTRTVQGPVIRRVDNYPAEKSPFGE